MTAPSPLTRPLLPPPPSNEGFTTHRPVRAGDVDTANRLRYDSVARYLQDIGSDNLDASGLADTDPFWIVRRTVIDVVRPSVWPERVTLHRWCSGLSSRWSNMRVRITGDKGAHIETEGFWINVSMTSGMPTRISDAGIELLTRTTDEQRLKWSAWLRDPVPDASAGDRPFPLRVTDVDALDHVNNAAYWQAVEEVLDDPDLGPITAGPHRAVIEYIAPIMKSDTVILRSRRHEVDGLPAVTIWFVVNDKVRTVAAVVARHQGSLSSQANTISS